MAKRYFNWKLAIVLVIGFVVLGTTAAGLRAWQRSRRAELGLEAGIKAYNQKKWEEAASNLGRYLAIQQDDVPTSLKYADAQLKIRPAKPNNVQQAISAYRNILRFDKSNSEAAMRLTEIYLAVGMPGEAELIARRQLEGDTDSQNDAKGTSPASKNPELRRLFALALASQRKFGEAAAELKAIVQEHPEQILAYETLGQLTEQRPSNLAEPAEHWFNQAVKDNPSCALAYISRAGFYLRGKDKTKALADLEQAEKLDLSDPAVRLRLAQEFINADVLERADVHLAVVQEATPTDQNLWQIWAQLALKSQSQEKMSKVAESGLKELSSQPWEFMPIACELFIQAGQLDRATDCISELRQKDIFPETVAFFEGLVAEQKEQYFEAIKCWRRSIELGNKSSGLRLMLASGLSRLGDRQSALRQLRTLVSERPDLLDGRLALVRLLAQTGNWAEVAEHAATAMQLSPQNLEAALAHLQARIQLLAANPPDQNIQLWQDIEKQLAALEKATGGAAEVKLLQFQLAMQQSDFAKAEAIVAEVKKTHASEVRVALAEVDLLVAQGKEDEAIQTLNKTIEEFPQAVDPVKYLAILLGKAGNHEKSEAVIKDALSRIKQPAAQSALGGLLADLYTSWKQENKVHELLDTLAQNLPNDIPIKRRLLACEQVTKNTEQAQQLINDIKSLEGNDGWQWQYEQAKVWFAADDFKSRYPQIVSLLRENVLANPDDQTSRTLLAAAYERAGELQLAISTYRDALNRSPDDVRIVISTIAALYKAKEYAQADEILSRAAREELRHPQLATLQLQSYIRRGQLNLASDILQDMLKNDPNNRSAMFSLALVKIQENKFADAEKLLAELRAAEPNSLPVIYAQVQLNIRQGKSQEALGLCDEVVNKLKNASAYILRARTYTMLEQTDKAAEDLQHAATLEPGNVEVWVARSQFYRSLGRPDLALADIQKAMSLAPSDVEIQKRAISLFLASNNPEKVKQGTAVLDETLKSNPQDTELLLFKARTILAEGTAPAIENATNILQKITEDQPQNSEPWTLLGEIALRQGQPGKAIDIALRGLVNKPKDKMLLLLKARAEAARSPVLAIPTLNVLREIDPSDVDIALQLAATYIATAEPEKAVNLLKEQLSSCKDTSQERRVNIAFAVALHKNGSKAEAQEKLDILLQSEPNDPAALLAQVRLLMEDKLWDKLTQKVDDWLANHTDDNRTPIAIVRNLADNEDSQAKQIAEDLLHKILQRDPNSLAAMNTLAMLLQMLGRNAESAKLYQQILQRAPDNVIAINNLAWIMCEEQGQYQQALELTQRGLAIAPQYIDLIDTRGVAYYQLGEFDKAVQDFTDCIKLYPSGTPAAVASRFHLARAYAGLRQRDKAIEHLNQALDLHSRTGGLSATDLAEAQHLLEQLQPAK